MILVPERRLSFVILANTERLTDSLANSDRESDIMKSNVAWEFLDTFVFPR